MTIDWATLVELLLAVAAGVGYVRARLNGMNDRIKKNEERLHELEKLCYSYPRREVGE